MIDHHKQLHVHSTMCNYYTCAHMHLCAYIVYVCLYVSFGKHNHVKNTLAVRVCSCLRQQSCILTSLVQVKNPLMVV